MLLSEGDCNGLRVAVTALWWLERSRSSGCYSLRVAVTLIGLLGVDVAT